MVSLIWKMNNLPPIVTLLFLPDFKFFLMAVPDIGKDYSRKEFLAWLKEKGIELFISKNNLALALASRLRDKDTTRENFRHTAVLLGEYLAFALSDYCVFPKRTVESPLTKTKGLEMPSDIVIIPVLRAGLPLAEGFSHAFQSVESTIISCWRDENLDVYVEYCKSPMLEGKTVVILDPMLATGNTLVAVKESLKKYGKPKKWICCSLFATPYGVRKVAGDFPKGTVVSTIYLDDGVFEKGFRGIGLNSHAYIVPGLGDSGDRTFGTPAFKHDKNH